MHVKRGNEITKKIFFILYIIARELVCKTNDGYCRSQETGKTSGK